MTMPPQRTGRIDSGSLVQSKFRGTSFSSIDSMPGVGEASSPITDGVVDGTVDVGIVEETASATVQVVGISGVESLAFALAALDGGTTFRKILPSALLSPPTDETCVATAVAVPKRHRSPVTVRRGSREC